MAVTYTIHVHTRDSIYEMCAFTATFDSYDGAPIDYETPSQDKIGHGDTEMEAMYDLLEQSRDE